MKNLKLERIAFDGCMHIRNTKTHETLFTIGDSKDGAIPNQQTQELAKLICAAPELLEAAKNLTKAMYSLPTGLNDLFEALETAIKNAIV